MVEGKTMATLAMALKAEGVDVADYRGSKEPDTAHSSVVFRGDDATGRRAVELGIDHGFEPEGLVRDWVVVGGELGEAHWLLLL